MIIAHIGYFLFSGDNWFQVIGRAAFPLFLFLVGFNSSYRWRWNLWIVAISLQIGYIVTRYIGLHHVGITLIILINIALVRVILNFLKRQKVNQSILFLILLCAWILDSYVRNIIDFGMMALMYGIVGYSFVNFKRRWSSTAMLFMVSVAYLFHEFIVFDFDILQRLGVIVVVVIVFFLLISLGKENRNMKLGRLFDSLILFISKNALWIYLLHVVVLVILQWAFQ